MLVVIISHGQRGVKLTFESGGGYAHESFFWNAAIQPYDIGGYSDFPENVTKPQVAQKNNK